MRSTGTVRVWHRRDGWGVIDCPDTPGGCFVHFSNLWNDEVPSPEPGEVVEITRGEFLEVFEGETVEFDWEPGSQDGYSFRAIAVYPHGREAPQRTVRYYKPGSAG